MTAQRYCWCDCGWRGARRELTNVKPCPRCGGKVFLPFAGRGRPRNAVEVVRVRVKMPRPWLVKLGPNAATTIRELVRLHLGEPARAE